MTRYAVHPMEMSYVEWDRDFKEKRLKYWTAIRTAHVDYEQNENHGYYEPTLNGFKAWMERKWGVKVEFIDGNISAMYTVVDEPKYSMFILKYIK